MIFLFFAIQPTEAVFYFSSGILKNLTLTSPVAGLAGFDRFDSGAVSDTGKAAFTGGKSSQLAGRGEVFYYDGTQLINVTENNPIAGGAGFNAFSLMRFNNAGAIAFPGGQFFVNNSVAIFVFNGISLQNITSSVGVVAAGSVPRINNLGHLAFTGKDQLTAATRLLDIFFFDGASVQNITGSDPLFGDRILQGFDTFDTFNNKDQIVAGLLKADGTNDVFLFSPVTSPPPSPVLSANPSSLDFGTVTVGASKDLTFTVQNTGGGTLTGNATASAPFSIVGNNSFSLTANQSQQITVRFSPTSATTFNGNVSITSNGGNSSIVLTGVGEALSPPVNQPDISLFPNPFKFGYVNLGTAVIMTGTIQNLGTAPLVVGTISNPPLPFSLVKDGCSSKPLNPASSCSFSVRFRPSTTGPVSSSLSVPSNDPDESPLTATLEGTGVGSGSAADITVTPTDINFEDIVVGQQSKSVRINIQNSGKSPLTIQDFVSPLSPFGVERNFCFGQTLDGGERCTLDVVFRPTAEESYNKILTIKSNDPDEPVLDVAVQGAGLMPRAVIIDVDGLRADVVRAALNQPENYPGLAEIFGSRARVFTNAWTIFPSVTLAGQASIFTGNYPGKHGIVGNQWFDRTFSAGNPYPCPGGSLSDVDNEIIDYVCGPPLLSLINDLLSVKTPICVYSPDANVVCPSQGLANFHLQALSLYSQLKLVGIKAGVNFNQYWQGATKHFAPTFYDLGIYLCAYKNNPLYLEFYDCPDEPGVWETAIGKKSDFAIYDTLGMTSLAETLKSPDPSERLDLLTFYFNGADGYCHHMYEETVFDVKLCQLQYLSEQLDRQLMFIGSSLAKADPKWKQRTLFVVT